MKQLYIKGFSLLAALCLTAILSAQTTLYPSAEKSYRTNTNAVLGTAWNSGFPKDTNNDVFEIRYTSRMFVMQQYDIPNMANVASITITITRQSGQSTSREIGAWLYPDSEWNGAAYADFVENVKTITGIYPGSSETDSTKALCLAPMANATEKTTTAELEQRTMTFSASAIAALKNAAEITSGTGKVSFLLTTANLFDGSNYKFYSSKEINADNRPTMTVTYGAVAPDPIVNKNSGNGYTDLSTAIAAATSGDTLVVNEDQSISSRLNINKAIVITAGPDGATIQRASNYTNGIVILTSDAATNLTLCSDGGNLTLDGGNLTSPSVFFEASKGNVTLKDICVRNAISTSNQGVISNKTSGKLLLQNVAFDNCTVNEGYGVLFVGTNNVSFAGNNTFSNCNGNVYIENYTITDAGTTNTTAIALTLKTPETRTVENVVLNCTDLNKFALTNDGYHLVSDGTNLKFAAGSQTGLALSEANDLRIVGQPNAIVIEANEARQINIVAVDGRLVRTLQLLQGQNLISGLAQGIYFVEGKKVIVY